MPAGSLFDAAAAEYDAARPSYPDSLYAALTAQAGPLTGELVLDCGAGTGIASRQLAERGATVVSLDLGVQMLRRALARDPAAVCVAADCHQLPVRDGRAGLTAFAQCWHWFDQPRAAVELARVLRPDGCWAAWWNNATDDGSGWLDRYRQALAAGCPSYDPRRYEETAQTDIDWSQQGITAAGLFEPVAATAVSWTRSLTADAWLTDERSKSHLINLAPAARAAMVSQLAAIIVARFPDGQLTVPYLTTLRVARRLPPRP